MKVMKTMLKSSTRSATSGVKKAYERLMEVAGKSVSARMVDLFLNTDLLAHLSVIPASSFFGYPRLPPSPLAIMPSQHHTSSTSANTRTGGHSGHSKM
ncbi:hypothetical protein KP509_23G045700 [Ceratopteris richardii]|nr:hypothetical protein KP509_23G045700 [Ceratopteris richardii]